MSRRTSPKLELKLNLSPPRSNNNSPTDSPNASGSSSDMSIDRCSCVSSDEPEDHRMMHYPDSPETKAMVLAGCPRCLMYVMLSEVDPKCPKCKSTVLLDFLNEESTKRS